MNLIREVYERAGLLQCAVCGKAHPREEVDVHHIVPLNCGGQNDVTNMAVLCQYHHQLAHRLWNPMPGVYLGPMNRDQLINQLRPYVDPVARLTSSLARALMG